MEEHCYAVVLFMLNVTYNHYMLSFIVPIFIILSFIKLSAILLSVIMLSVVIMNVVALPSTIKSTSFFFGFSMIWQKWFWLRIDKNEKDWQNLKKNRFLLKDEVLKVWPQISQNSSQWGKLSITGSIISAAINTQAKKY